LLSPRKQGLTPDKEVYEKHLADLSGKLDVYEQILSKQKYLVGDVRQFLPADT
jgi:glutathione S-transferase